MSTIPLSMPKSDRELLRELMRTALPIIGMTVTRMLMVFVDFVMVSQMGTEAQAAISPATLLVFVIGCVGMGAVQSVQTFVAQACGRNEPRVAGAYAWQTLYIAAAFHVLIWPVAASTRIWYGWIASAAHASPAVAELQIAYVEWALWQTSPAILSIGLQGFYNGIQKSRVALTAMLVSVGVNAGLNYVLIWGKLGFPEMGIGGAALATVIGWWVRVALMVIPLFFSANETRYGTRSAIGLDRAKLLAVLKLGAPIAMLWLADLGSWVVFQQLVLPPYGTSAMAASNVALQFMHLGFMPAIGIGIALCSQVGFAIGAGTPDDALRRTTLAMRVTGLYMGGIGLLMVVFSGPLVGWFNADPAVIAIGRQVLIWIALFQVFDAMCITYMNALRGAGDTNVPARLTALCCWGIFVGGGFAVSRLAPGWGLNAPWAMCMLYVVALGVLVWRRWNSGVWRSIHLAAGGERGPTGAPALDGV